MDPGNTNQLFKNECIQLSLNWSELHYFFTETREQLQNKTREIVEGIP